MASGKLVKLTCSFLDHKEVAFAFFIKTSGALHQARWQEITSDLEKGNQKSQKREKYSKDSPYGIVNKDYAEWSRETAVYLNSFMHAPSANLENEVRHMLVMAQSFSNLVTDRNEKIDNEAVICMQYGLDDIQLD